MDDEHDATFELLVPFVVTESHGGPFDDAAFVAGFEMGKLWAWCAANENAGLVSLSITIRRANRTQADLIAMNYGARVVDVDSVDPIPGEELSIAPGVNEWCPVVVTWIPAGDGEVD